MTQVSGADIRAAEALLEKARTLAPVLRQRAAETNKARRVPEETIRDFWKAGLWYLLKPKKFGGPEHRPDIALSVAYELARGDGSAAWVWAVMTIHDLLVALWPEEFQKEYWAKDTLSASSFAPMGKATPANGGFRISGKWSFSSGVDNADWMLLGVFFGPPSGGSPIPDIRYVMLPKGDYKVIDDWFVSGLRGTGSKGIVVEDAFVPNHRICGLADMIQGKTPGSQIHDSPLYKASVWGIIPFTISSPANGMARGALDAFIDDMKVREGSYDHSPLANKPGMHLVVAEASAMIDSADLLYRRSFRETIDKISAFLDRTLRGAILPLGWHHGDYDFANLLYGPDDSVRGILDFEVFDAHGLPLIDLLLLLARRPIRKQGVAFGTLFVRSILGRELPPLEAGLLQRELTATGIDDEMYRAIAFCCWLNHLRLRRDSWLVRSSSWLDENLHAVVEHVRTTL